MTAPQPTELTPPRRGLWLAAGLAGLALLVSTLLLALVVWPHGPRMTHDSLTYLGGAVSLLHGEGLTLHRIDVPTGALVAQPAVHYPPLTASSYAVLMLLGVPYGLAPAVVALLGWLALLPGVGLLAYRLSGSALAAALALGLVAVTQAALTVFTQAMSEPLFLPLLVWLMVVLADTPARTGWALWWRLGLATLLLALLPLTRYVGVLALGSVLLWWGWLRLAAGQAHRLLREGPLLALAALPLAAWLGRNYLLRDAFTGAHFQGTRDTFAAGVQAVVEQATQLGLPALLPLAFPIDWSASWWATLPALGYILALLVWGGLLWWQRPRRGHLLAPPCSPLVLFVLAYLALYVFVQPFMLFSPLDARDMTSVLVLVLPWLCALLALALPRWHGALLGCLLALNMALAALPLVQAHTAGVLTLRPLAVHDLAEQRGQANRYRHQGVPDWLLVWNWGHTRRIERTHPQAATFIHRLPPPAGIISNARYTVVYTDRSAPPTGFVASLTPLDTWLAQGSCQPHDTLAIVLFDWSHLREDMAHYAPQIDAKCPDLPSARLANSLVYRLDAAGPDDARGQAYAQAGQWQAAIASYHAALAANPESVRAYANRARAYQAVGDMSRALADFDAALARMPEWATLRAERAQAAAQARP